MSKKLIITERDPFSLEVSDSEPFNLVISDRSPLFLTVSERLQNPVIVSAIVNEALAMLLTFDRALDPLLIPDFSDFVIITDGSPTNVSGIEISGILVTLTLDAAVQFGDVLSVTYLPGTTVLTGVNGLGVEAFTQDVVNNMVSPMQPETISLLSRMDVQPGGSLADLIDQTISDLKTAGIWSKLDVLYFRGLHTEQAAHLNWIKDAHNSLNIGGAQFVPNEGFKTATGQYLDTQFRDIDGINFNNPNSHFDAHIFYNIPQTLWNPVTDGKNYITDYRTSTRWYGYGYYFRFTNVLQPDVLYCQNGTNSGNNDYYINGVYDGFRFSGTKYPGLYSYREANGTTTGGGIKFSCYGSQLSAQEIADLNTIVFNFIDQ